MCCKLELVSKDSQQAIHHLSHIERPQLAQVYDNCKYNDKKEEAFFPVL